MKFISNKPEETQRKAEDLAKELSNKEPQKAGVVIGLEGELGAGKTTFAKGFAKGLGVKQKISSPTFVLMKSYNLKLLTYDKLFHIDAYRLEDHEDLARLGAKEIFKNPKNIVLVEWSDRVKKILPKNYVKIHIDHVDMKTRKISVKTFANTSFLRRTYRRRTAKEVFASV